jgi:hypothetical protein
MTNSQIEAKPRCERKDTMAKDSIPTSPLGKRILKFRETYKLTQADLSKRTGFVDALAQALAQDGGEHGALWI